MLYIIVSDFKMVFLSDFFHSFQISCTINIFSVANIEILLPTHASNSVLYLWIMQNLIWKYR